MWPQGGKLQRPWVLIFSEPDFLLLYSFALAFTLLARFSFRLQAASFGSDDSYRNWTCELDSWRDSEIRLPSLRNLTRSAGGATLTQSIDWKFNFFLIGVTCLFSYALVLITWWYINSTSRSRSTITIVIIVIIFISFTTILLQQSSSIVKTARVARTISRLINTIGLVWLLKICCDIFLTLYRFLKA